MRISPKNNFTQLLVPVLLFVSVVFFTTPPTFVYADEEIETPTENSLSEAQIGYLSRYCDSIKSSLKRLAVADSRTRTFFGGVYETLSSKFITPLNLRLVKNNLSLSDFLSLQSSFASSRSKFSSDFISYSKSLEELTAFDCKNQPEEFYEKLESTREERKKIKTDLSELNKLLNSHVSLVEELKESLNE